MQAAKDAALYQRPFVPPTRKNVLSTCSYLVIDSSTTAFAAAGEVIGASADERMYSLLLPTSYLGPLVLIHSSKTHHLVPPLVPPRSYTKETPGLSTLEEKRLHHRRLALLPGRSL